MKHMTIGAAICVVAAIAAPQLDKREDSALARDDLRRIPLADGTQLSLLIPAVEVDRVQTYKVSLTHHRRPDEVKNVIWSTDLMAVEYKPEYKDAPPPYYALVKVLEGRITVFSTWNSHYFVVDGKAGHVLEQGQGDEVLRRHGEWVPVKLKVILPSVGRRAQP